MKLMGYELPLGISITQHAPEMVDGFVENGFEYFEVGIPACLNREDSKRRIHARATDSISAILSNSPTGNFSARAFNLSDNAISESTRRLRAAL